MSKGRKRAAPPAAPAETSAKATYAAEAAAADKAAIAAETEGQQGSDTPTLDAAGPAGLETISDQVYEEMLERLAEENSRYGGG